VERILEGVLIAVAWADSGDVREIGLTSFDEVEYRIEAPTERAYRMRDHLQNHVRMLARLEGNRVIGATWFEVVRDGRVLSRFESHADSAGDGVWRNYA